MFEGVFIVLLGALQKTQYETEWVKDSIWELYSQIVKGSRMADLAQRAEYRIAFGPRIAITELKMPSTRDVNEDIP